LASPRKPNGEPKAAQTLFVRWLRRLLIAAAYAYPLSLLAVYLAFANIGERWWVTTGLLYLPPWGFAAPLLVLLPALAFTRLRRLLWTQAVAGLLIAFPLMGLVLPWPVAAHPGAASLKLLSFNINQGWAGYLRLLSTIEAQKPDLVLLQEAPGWGGPLMDGLRARFPYVEGSTEFIIASRFPILERTEPESLLHEGRLRAPRFMRYVVAGPLGPLAVYSLHPVSPRGALGVRQFRGVFRGLRSGQLFKGDPASGLGQNAALRSKQLVLATRLASKEHYPVLLAGDTNLPELSAIRRNYLSGFTDAFHQASWGFGYTFPERSPFLRLDRIMSGPELRFSEFQVGCPGASDHLCVAARVIRR
jgi:endonuclease/exonuclease/phosphatase (EEP) superfamily protein YafD